MVNDGLANAITGQGTRADRTAFARYVQFCPVDAAQVEAAYRTSGLIRKVHDLPPSDMTREWRDWQADKGDIAKLEGEEKRLNLHAKVHTALLWARIYGGSAIILGDGSSNPAQPLRVTSAGGLKYVNVASRYTLSFDEIDLDPTAEFYGQPKMWRVNSAKNGNVDVHPSRVIPFIAQPIPQGMLGLSSMTFWGDPLLESIQQAAKNSDSVLNNIAALVEEAKTDHVGIPDLMAMVGTAEYEARLMQRLDIVNRAKSIHHLTITDANETWDQKQITFATLPDVAKLHLMVLAGASDIPVTRLLGKSADGMNATGAGDDKNYDRMIATKQERELQPCLNRIDEALIPSAGVAPGAVHWLFAPLDEPTEKERADIFKITMDAVEKVANGGYLPESALAKSVANLLIENGSLPGLDEAIKEAEAAGEVPPILEEPEEGEIEPGEEGEDDLDAPPAPRRAANDALTEDERKGIIDRLWRYLTGEPAKDR